MKVKLTVNDTVGGVTNSKEMDLDIENITELERLAILNNVFQMIGVSNSLSEMVDDFIKIGTAYKKFYSSVKSEEPTDRKPLDLKLRYPENEGKEDDKPDHYKSGIIEEDGKKKYKCRLHCECGTNKNLYMDKTLRTIQCPACSKVHQVRDAKEAGFPTRDGWGNYFIAGKFIGEDEHV